MRNWFPHRRPKTYAAQSGYVYRYVFEGVRETGEYVFTAVAGSAQEILLTVFLDSALIDDWIRTHRPLNETERYGIAKLALFRAFDESADPVALSQSVRPGTEEIAEFCINLDF